jgi:hypothetical protein
MQPRPQVWLIGRLLHRTAMKEGLLGGTLSVRERC